MAHKKIRYHEMEFTTVLCRTRIAVACVSVLVSGRRQMRTMPVYTAVWHCLAFRESCYPLAAMLQSVAGVEWRAADLDNPCRTYKWYGDLSLLGAVNVRFALSCQTCNS